MCQSCFTVLRAKARVAAFRLKPAGVIPDDRELKHRCRLETTRYGM